MEQLVEEVLRWEPSYVPARLEKAKLLVRKSKPQEAVKEATKALEQASGDVELEENPLLSGQDLFQLGANSRGSNSPGMDPG